MTDRIGTTDTPLPDQRAGVTVLLADLYGLVMAECPRLLDEDSGGNAKLAMTILDALEYRGLPVQGEPICWGLLIGDLIACNWPTRDAAERAVKSYDDCAVQPVAVPLFTHPAPSLPAGGEEKQGVMASREPSLSAGSALDGWQPISPAPTFQHVLAWFPEGEHVITLMGSKPTSFECVGYFAKTDPTHWMPLPAAPLSTDGKTGPGMTQNPSQSVRPETGER